MPSPIIDRGTRPPGQRYAAPAPVPGSGCISQSGSALFPLLLLLLLPLLLLLLLLLSLLPLLLPPL